MKLKNWQTVLLIGICIGTLAITGYRASAEEEILNNSDFLRFHVVANSDDAKDQKLKLTVRDGLLKELEINLSLEESRQYIADNLKMIEKTAEEIVKRQGYNYTIKAELGVRWIPEKTYENVTFPAGNYEALTVTIGEGKGENWWCVLFPPLCLIGEKAPENLDEKYAPIANTSGEKTTLKLKFKTLEIIDHIK